jgi:hypothetical protein
VIYSIICLIRLKRRSELPLVVKVEVVEDTSKEWSTSFVKGVERAAEKIGKEAADIIKDSFSTVGSYTGNLKRSFDYKVTPDAHNGFVIEAGIDKSWVAGPSEPTGSANPVTRYVVPLDQGAAPIHGRVPVGRLKAYAEATGAPLHALIIAAKRGTLKRANAQKKWGPGVERMLQSKGLKILETETEGLK